MSKNEEKKIQDTDVDQNTDETTDAPVDETSEPEVDYKFIGFKIPVRKKAEKKPKEKKEPKAKPNWGKIAAIGGGALALAGAGAKVAFDLLTARNADSQDCDDDESNPDAVDDPELNELTNLEAASESSTSDDC